MVYSFDRDNRKLRVLVTGSLDFHDTPENRELMRRALSVPLYDTEYHRAWLPSNITIVHGGARGAYSIACLVARELGMNVEVHLAQWADKGKSAEYIRNKKMVDLGADSCLAFPVGLEEGKSKGTANQMSVAQKAGIPVHVMTTS